MITTQYNFILHDTTYMKFQKKLNYTEKTYKWVPGGGGQGMRLTAQGQKETIQGEGFILYLDLDDSEIPVYITQTH